MDEEEAKMESDAKATSVGKTTQAKTVETKTKSLGPGEREGAVPERTRQVVRMGGGWMTSPAATERDRGKRRAERERARGGV